jgi:hypothetical protein
MPIFLVAGCRLPEFDASMKALMDASMVAQTGMAKAVG